MFYSRQWNFIADMNYSGSITIYDVWSWLKWLYFYPGDGFVYFLVNKFPGIGQFFEITYSSYGGVLSGVVSFFVWIIITSWILRMISEFKTTSVNPKPAKLKPSIPINVTPSQAADPNFKIPSPKKNEKAQEKLYYANLDPDSAEFKAYWGNTNQKPSK